MYLKLKNLCLIALVSAIVIIDGCTLSEKTGKQKAQPETLSPVIPGWVKVSIGIDAEYISSNLGNLSELYDEFVGGLFDEGLLIDHFYWIKPVYGNENLLWTFDAHIGLQRKKPFTELKDEFTNSGYDIIDGTLDIAGSEWHYFGYSSAMPASGSPDFRSYVFVCRSETSQGVSAFYWGNSGINLPKNNSSIIQLLTLLSSRC